MIAIVEQVIEPLVFGQGEERFDGPGEQLVILLIESDPVAATVCPGEVYPANASFSALSLADNGEVLRQQ
jgi:hypothetical protein